MEKVNWRYHDGFKNIAKEVKRAREYANKSQEVLSKELGYKHGQFISNVELGKCSLPLFKVIMLSEVTGYNIDKIMLALRADYIHRLTIMCNKHPEYEIINGKVERVVNV